jgi:hypothetical protein
VVMEGLCMRKTIQIRGEVVVCPILIDKTAQRHLNS